MAICTKCERFIDPKEAGNPCPECGSGDRYLSIEDKVNVLEMLKSKGESRDGFMLFERKQGEKLSNYGRKARELLEFDHRDPEKTTKTHIVEEQTDDGSWEVCHDEHEEFPAKRRLKHEAEDS